MRKFKKKERQSLHPLMTYVVFIIITILASGFLNLMDSQATFHKINDVTLHMFPETEVVKSLFSLVVPSAWVNVSKVYVSPLTTNSSP